MDKEDFKTMVEADDFKGIEREMRGVKYKLEKIADNKFKVLVTHNGKAISLEGNFKEVCSYLETIADFNKHYFNELDKGK